MKKLINNPANVVREMLEGLVDLNPNLAILDTENIIIRYPTEKSLDEVAIISGGGSGHEPAQAGYVGDGLLSAAVAGDVFTSPSTDSVLAAIRHCNNKNGVLLIVTNYTGDRLNFGLAAELARNEGIKVETVIVADDVALCNTVPKERRRGIAGTVLVNKIAGSAAASGLDLNSVKKVTEYAASNLASMGVALGACTIPASGKPGFEIPDDEIEIGLGLHGEKGVERVKIKTSDELVEIIINNIISDLKIGNQDKVVVLVNGLGGTPIMELNIIARHTLKYLRSKYIDISRIWVSNFMTSLEMPGFSISIMKINNDLLKFFDYPTNAPSWISKGVISNHRNIITNTIKDKSESKISEAPNLKLKLIGEKIATELELAEAKLTYLDSQAGDGDLGLSMSRGAKAIRELPLCAWANPVTMLNSIGEALRRAIGGSSGPFYATGLIRAARFLASQDQIDSRAIAGAFIAAADAISEIGGAKLNDRTMLDALYPAAISFNESIKNGMSLETSLDNAIKSAEDGVKNTAQMLPKMGRASYLGERAIGFEDAGAYAVLVWLKAIKFEENK